METILGFILMALFICLIIGLVKPSIILRWDKKPNRIKVFIYWFFLSMLIGFLLPKEDQVNEGQFNYNQFEKRYEIILFNEEVQEMGVIKAQIAQRIYFGNIDSSLSKDEIELYLNERVKKIDDREGFKNFDNASHVIIWLHASIDHAVEGGANWIAMIDKFGEESSVNFRISQDKLDYLKSPTNDTVNDITEENREEIFRAIVHIEDKSVEDANLNFPDPNDWEKHFDFQERRYNIYLSQLLNHYDINDDLRFSIMSEGIKKGWLEKTGVISLNL